MRISDWSSDVCSSYLRDVSTAPLRMRLSLGSGEDLGSRAATTERQADQAKAPDHRHPGRRFGDFRNQADARTAAEAEFFGIERLPADDAVVEFERSQVRREVQRDRAGDEIAGRRPCIAAALAGAAAGIAVDANIPISAETRSEEHTSELQSLMRNSYAVFCLKKKIHKKNRFMIKLNKQLKIKKHQSNIN